MAKLAIHPLMLPILMRRVKYRLITVPVIVNEVGRFVKCASGKRHFQQFLDFSDVP
jgi:hypothetical protein